MSGSLSKDFHSVRSVSVADILRNKLDSTLSSSDTEYPSSEVPESEAERPTAVKRRRCLRAEAEAEVGGGGRWLRTEVRRVPNGVLLGDTRAWTSKLLHGFTGGVRVYVWGDRETLLWRTELERFPAEARLVSALLFCCHSQSHRRWEQLVPPKFASRAVRLELFQAHHPTGWIVKAARQKCESLFNAVPSSFLLLLPLFLLLIHAVL